MGGFAIEVDWAGPIPAGAADAMMAPVPHRSGAGLGRLAFATTVMAEGRAQPTWDGEPRIATLGPLAIVGDLRLWSRDGLRSRAGGLQGTRGMDDRLLLLAAYHRTGTEFLDDVDGDFAFVIWDDDERRAVAVRDRFGAKPLFYEATPTGIRFASEVKQLATTSQRTIEPNARSVAEYLDDRYRESRFSFFDGINRVRPAMALVADEDRHREVRYWNPGPGDPMTADQRDVAAGFREHITEAVRQRISTSNATVAHLTGGLDSPSIAAAANMLSSRRQLPSAFHTVSAVFPGYAADDSRWIDAIAAEQPFPHHDFVPEIDSIDAFDGDMWAADQPRVHRIRGMWAGTASIADEMGADLLLTGSGGDQILDRDQVVVDRLRTGSLSQRLSDLRLMTSTSPRALSRILTDGARAAFPTGLKQRLRPFVRRRHPIHNPLVRFELLDALASESVESAPIEFGFPTRAQDYVVAFALHPSISWFNEIRETEYATTGLSVSYPFLDRDVVEYVASIPVRDQPFDGRTKSLVREGFSGLLPSSVLDRRTKTIADDYLDHLFAVHGAQYQDRYPAVTDRALEYLDGNRYTAMVKQSASSPPDYATRESLWNAWTLMAWLDGLDRY